MRLKPIMFCLFFSVCSKLSAQVTNSNPGWLDRKWGVGVGYGLGFDLLDRDKHNFFFKAERTLNYRLSLEAEYENRHYNVDDWVHASSTWETLNYDISSTRLKLKSYYLSRGSIAPIGTYNFIYIGRDVVMQDSANWRKFKAPDQKIDYGFGTGLVTPLFNTMTFGAETRLSLDNSFRAMILDPYTEFRVFDFYLLQFQLAYHF
jgi:hypothetical protein